tara:strand:+ start:1487 stop:2212 length:726 start_codon:yes stop_codon:yes gene_type:complete
MHKPAREARAYVNEFLPLIQHISNVDIILAPPFTSLHVVKEAIKDTTIGLASQNMHWNPHGAFTGEISPAMLCDSGCQAAIIGHSERRQLSHEDDNKVNRKVKAAIAHHLTAIMCVGETQKDRDAGKTSDVLSHQLIEGLSGIDTIDTTQLILAYEPIWAIGSGTPATPTQANRVHAELRKLLGTLFPASTTESIRIIYGGSITAENIQPLLAMPHIDGGLVGGACLNPQNFATIVDTADN